jgi:hypothetical protein
MEKKIGLEDLFSGMFNSSFFEEIGIDKEDMWDNFFSYNFPKEELIILEQLKNGFGFDFSKFSQNTLEGIFSYIIHGNGYIEKFFDNQEDDMYYPTVEFYYSDYLKMGYIYLTESHETLCFDDIGDGEKLYEIYFDYGKRC